MQTYTLLDGTVINVDVASLANDGTFRMQVVPLAEPGADAASLKLPPWLTFGIRFSNSPDAALNLTPKLPARFLDFTVAGAAVVGVDLDFAPNPPATS